MSFGPILVLAGIIMALLITDGSPVQPLLHLHPPFGWEIVAISIIAGVVLWVRGKPEHA